MSSFEMQLLEKARMMEAHFNAGLKAATGLREMLEAELKADSGTPKALPQHVLDAAIAGLRASRLVPGKQ
jgi:hypothetical protein